MMRAANDNDRATTIVLFRTAAVVFGALAGLVAAAVEDAVFGGPLIFHGLYAVLGG